MKTGIELITEERQRQMAVEGWTARHDDNHDKEQLAVAASCYALPEQRREVYKSGKPKIWPWGAEWWKPSERNRIRELMKAGALIAAEIDRLQRKKNVITTNTNTDAMDKSK